MKLYYDLHIHSCLSPCGDPDMTPNNIVNMAVLSGLQVIALTDHNTCGNCAATAQVAAAAGLIFLPGMELCTAEEIHVVCLFPTVEAALAFERQVRPTLPPIQNRADIFGEQTLCDAEDRPVGTEPLLLTTASGISVDHVAGMVAALGGVAYPAHIDRPSYSITAALGDIPPLGFTAYEVTDRGDTAALTDRFPELRGKPLLQDSDAHYLEHMAESGPWLEPETPTAAAIVAALRGETPCGWGRTAG